METDFLRGGNITTAAFVGRREMEEYGKEKPRTVEELIALGDRHFNAFSNSEMNVLFQYLREKDAIVERNNGDYWKLLQHRLQSRGIAITVFEPGGHAESDIGMDDLFHHLWTRSAGKGEYLKMAWKVFRKQLQMRGVSV